MAVIETAAKHVEPPERAGIGPSFLRDPRVGSSGSGPSMETEAAGARGRSGREDICGIFCNPSPRG
jgi:hypothetical protein